MFDDLIINNSFNIIKFLNRLDLDLFFTKPQLRHIIAFVIAMALKGYKGKVSDASELTSHRHRTNIGKFLNKSPWNEEFLTQAIREYNIKCIWRMSKNTGNPIYIIIDDTVCEKTLPSSKAQNTIQGCSFHSSHLKKKVVYGHQFVTVMLRCGDTVLPYAMVMYNKETMSKIEVVQDVLNTLPEPINQGYVLADSWYSCKKLFDAAADKGFYYLGAFKSNRIIYPKGYKTKGIQIGAFSKTIKMHELSLVTAGGKSYYTYTYQGKINGSKKVKIVISWPKDALYNSHAMKIFISLDIKMSEKQLLRHYVKRWAIETFFRETKRYLGLDQYQIQSLKGIKRYMTLLMLIYTYCELEVTGNTLKFSGGLKQTRQEAETLKVSWIFEKAQSGVALNEVLHTLKIA